MNLYALGFVFIERSLWTSNTFGLLVPFTNGGNAYLHDSKQENIMLIWKYFISLIAMSLQSWNFFAAVRRIFFDNAYIVITSILWMFISIFGHSVFSASVPSSKGPYMFPFSKSFLSLCLSFEKSSLLKISLSAQCILCQMQLFSLSQFGFSNAARRYSTESQK